MKRTLVALMCLTMLGFSEAASKPSYKSSSKKPVTAPAASEPTATAATTEKVPFNSRVESVTRTVEIQKAGGNGWKKAESKAALEPSDKIKTGPRSLARVKLGDGSKILLLQNSQAEMEKLSSVQKTVKLLRGRIRAIVAKIKGGNNFQISTPVGVASVRGTDFEVELSEDGQNMEVEVNEGQVGVARLGDLAGEVILNAGEHIKFGFEGEFDPIRSGGAPINRDDYRSEVQLARVKEGVVSMAAEEARNADYQTGKSLMDVNGQRVRVEQYIMRPAANQYKLVVLNERPTRFDYFTYKGTFNQALPTDLSVALGQIGGKLGTTAPDYYLTEYETLMSNTIDSVTDSASGGHLVKIEFDGTNYTLTDASDSSNTRTIEAAELQSDGSYKIYNPLRDTFSLVTAANKDEAMKIAVLENGSYRNFTTGDTYWKGRFNTYSMFVNTTAKTAYTKKNTVDNTLAIDLDANFSNAAITSITEFPSGASNLHNRLSLFYSDGSKLTYNNYIIDDEGNVIPTSNFSGVSSSADYKNELDELNYETVVTATEFGGRKIDLVIDPRIGTQSGLIQ